MSLFVRGNKLFGVDTPPARIAMKTPTKGLGQVYAVCKGDYLWVASRTKNGWLRVKNERTHKVTSLRVGPWVQKLSSNWGRHIHQLEYSLTPKVPFSSGDTEQEDGALLRDALALSQRLADEHRETTSNTVPITVPALECIPPTSSCVDQMIRKSQVDQLEAAWKAQESEIIKLESELSESRLLCASRLTKAVECELEMQRAHTRLDELGWRLVAKNQELQSTVHDERMKLRDTVVAKIGAIGAAHMKLIDEQVFDNVYVAECDWDLASRTLSSALADVRQCVINSVLETRQEDTANGYSSC